MLEQTKNLTGNSARGPSTDSPQISGVAKAVELARCGQLISAIKHLEAMNPELSRKTARQIVDSWGYGHQTRWPEEDKLPLRCL